jgi:hypothetical protein
LRQLMGIAQQLEPYIKSISSLMDEMQPEVGGGGGGGGGGVGSALAPLVLEAEQLQPPTNTLTSLHQQQSKGTTSNPYSSNTAPPANFNRQPHFEAPQLLPERIRTAISLADYKSR